MCYSRNALLHPHTRPHRGLWAGDLWVQATPGRRRDQASVWVASVFCQSLCLERRDHRWPSQAAVIAHASPLGRRWLGWRWEQAVKRLQPAHRVLCSPGCQCRFAPGGGPFAVGLHPLPPPSSQACLSGLASRPHRFHRVDQQGPLPVLPFASLLGASEPRSSESSLSIWPRFQVALETGPGSCDGV